MHVMYIFGHTAQHYSVGPEVVLWDLMWFCKTWCGLDPRPDHISSLSCCNMFEFSFCPSRQTEMICPGCPSSSGGRAYIPSTEDLSSLQWPKVRVTPVLCVFPPLSPISCQGKQSLKKNPKNKIKKEIISIHKTPGNEYHMTIHLHWACANWWKQEADC